MIDREKLLFLKKILLDEVTLGITIRFHIYVYMKIDVCMNIDVYISDFSFTFG